METINTKYKFNYMDLQKFVKMSAQGKHKLRGLKNYVHFKFVKNI